MTPDTPLRLTLAAEFLIIFPIAIVFRVRSHATREPLDRRQEGVFILATLRPAGLAHLVGVILYLINPGMMTWAAVPLPLWMRWIGPALLAATGGLLLWTLASLGKNLTDTVVTRRAHTLVTHGPYRFVRHPFYDCVLLLMLSTSLAAANWFLFVTGTLLFVFFVIRTRTEEDHLLRRFGDSYRNYMAHTGRFLPRAGATPAER